MGNVVSSVTKLVIEQPFTITINREVQEKCSKTSKKEDNTLPTEKKKSSKMGTIT